MLDENLFPVGFGNPWDVDDIDILYYYLSYILKIFKQKKHANKCTIITHMRVSMCAAAG